MIALDASALAGEILRDIREKRAFRRFADDIGRDMERAQAVQTEVVQGLLGDQPGRRIGGYKIAFNRPSSRDYYKIAEPCFAPILNDLVHPDGASLQLSETRELLIEAEIALVLGQDLPAHVYIGSHEVADAVSHACVAIELLDVRGAFAQDPSAAEATAQGIYNVGAVLGNRHVPLAALDWQSLDCALTIDGSELASASAAAPQPPLEALTWLARRLGRDGQALKTGMVVLTGAHLPGQAIAAPCKVEIAMGALGRVTMSTR